MTTTTAPDTPGNRFDASVAGNLWHLLAADILDPTSMLDAAINDASAGSFGMVHLSPTCTGKRAVRMTAVEVVDAVTGDGARHVLCTCAKTWLPAALEAPIRAAVSWLVSTDASPDTVALARHLRWRLAHPPATQQLPEMLRDRINSRTRLRYAMLAATPDEPQFRASLLGALARTVRDLELRHGNSDVLVPPTPGYPALAWEPIRHAAREWEASRVIDFAGHRDEHAAREAAGAAQQRTAAQVWETLCGERVWVLRDSAGAGGYANTNATNTGYALAESNDHTVLCVPATSGLLELNRAGRLATVVAPTGAYDGTDITDALRVLGTTAYRGTNLDSVFDLDKVAATAEALHTARH